METDISLIRAVAPTDWWLINQVILNTTSCLEDLSPEPVKYREFTVEQILAALGIDENPRGMYIAPNVGNQPLRHLVIWFDLSSEEQRWQDEGTSLYDIHPSLIIQLATGGKGRSKPTLPLVLVVNDGQDRMIAWFSLKGISDKDRMGFFVRVAKLGGERGKPDSPVRTPAGINEHGGRHTIEYFDRDLARGVGK
jgi:hypothetical protein